MCLDRQILSLYIDGELPSPWKERMEAHAGSCPDCQVRLENYRKLRSVLLSGETEDAMETAKRRVWSALAGKDENRVVPAGFSPVKPKRRDVWGRTISLPLPAVAAAAAVFAVITFLAVLGLRSSASARFQEPAVAAGIGTDLQGIGPVTDMNGVLQYLSRQDTAEYMIIRLPESRNFSSAGEPALLKATDYSRRRSSQ
jgi:anti-sigma factor RsiW